jgi:uncharacterized protein (DUF1015 family)
MPALAPFRGIRYAAPAELSSLICPPYDVITPELRDALAARSPHNLVHLVLDRERPGDGPADNRYTRAARSFREWQEQGILKRDPRPALYPLEQSFPAPDGRPMVRRGFLAAVRLHDFGEKVIVPHECTLPAVQADRLALVSEVRANLSPVFGLYEDDANVVIHALAASFGGEAVAQADSDDGVHHRMWRVEDPEIIAAVRKILAARQVLIADGHHRYEAALAYRDRLVRAEPGLPADGGHQHVLMFLCSTSDPGLVIYPTHRALAGLIGFRLADLLERLPRYFRVETIAEDVRRPAGRAWAVSKLSEHLGKSSAFLMVTAEDQKGRILTLMDEADLSGLPLPKNENLRALDVTALHGIVFQALLGLSPASVGRQENVRYLLDAGEAVARTLAGEFQVAFLLNPTPMWQVQAVGEAGETMPQKSTYFYPKIPGGMVFREIDPRGAP